MSEAEYDIRYRNLKAEFGVVSSRDMAQWSESKAEPEPEQYFDTLVEEFDEGEEVLAPEPGTQLLAVVMIYFP